VGTTAAQSSGGQGLGSWLSNTDNYDGVVDKTGQKNVTVTVGASANGGAFGFGPAAVRIDPGTTVVWEWTGKGGSHNVVAEDGSFESALSGASGHTFEYTVESSGVITYACVPHEAMGMKGALVVGDVDVGGGEKTAGSGSQGGPDFGSWFEDVGNYDGVVDKTGQKNVTVTVGARGNNGSFAFDPPAVRIDPGTTVVWEWTGKGGSHNVVAEDGSFESALTGAAGHTFEQTVKSEGVVEYACVPHKPMGMKGALVVGSAEAGDGDDDSGLADTLTLGGGVGLVGTLLGLFALGTRAKAAEHQHSPG
jgi:halocyanin-like protein